MTSLEGWGSAIELRPRVRCGVGPTPMRTDSVPVLSRAAGVTAWVPAAAEAVRGARRGLPSTVSYGSVSPGCSAAWLARLLWEQEAAGSNPAIPTKSAGHRVVVRDQGAFQDRLTVI
jgi:hypothetical protein